MVKTLLFVVLAAVALLLIYAAAQPDDFSVQRSASVRAPAQKIHPLIDDLHAFNGWNPFVKKDPALKGSYRGPARGPGAGYDFAGNAQVGEGSIEIVGSQTPATVAMRLDMRKPIAGHNRVEFSLMPSGDATEVTWAMHGERPFVSKLIGVFIDMDRMIGREFESGLAELKAVAERG